MILLGREIFCGAFTVADWRLIAIVAALRIVPRLLLRIIFARRRLVIVSGLVAVVPVGGIIP